MFVHDGENIYDNRYMSKRATRRIANTAIQSWLWEHRKQGKEDRSIGSAKMSGKKRRVY